mmetsp:Transcript_23580/g.74032  ORF Transcript_23580/g.74032 Transcript_23580/m.74032 type:complete len:204 (-) Transcript_23580:6784-7395(-)
MWVIVSAVTFVSCCTRSLPSRLLMASLIFESSSTLQPGKSKPTMDDDASWKSRHCRSSTTNLSARPSPGVGRGPKLPSELFASGSSGRSKSTSMGGMIRAFGPCSEPLESPVIRLRLISTSRSEAQYASRHMASCMSRPSVPWALSRFRMKAGLASSAQQPASTSAARSAGGTRARGTCARSSVLFTTSCTVMRACSRGSEAS